MRDLIFLESHFGEDRLMICSTFGPAIGCPKGCITLVHLDAATGDTITHMTLDLGALHSDLDQKDAAGVANPVFSSTGALLALTVTGLSLDDAAPDLDSYHSDDAEPILDLDDDASSRIDPDTAWDDGSSDAASGAGSDAEPAFVLVVDTATLAVRHLLHCPIAEAQVYFSWQEEVLVILHGLTSPWACNMVHMGNGHSQHISGA
ncbi:hypothetical protein WJX73_000558 [Symbiochloris irregularis]|uniref:Cleavage/polyadenylation specificity factor A subunit N-terminal domain-containing protein n=1 Tax=Symbiochloris irregularis TaxID=706552 RepID=A0AAW1PHQ1_9CHLO